MKSVLILLLTYVLSASQILGQDQTESHHPKPDVYIDGNKYDYKIFSLLDPEKIASVKVLKGNEALEKYGAENGVILVKTRQAELDTNEAGELAGDNQEKHLIIIDGEVADSDDLIILNRKDVKSIKVMKGSEAKEKYNAPNGVVIITTKKK
tara:strand:+ start:1746 stop:2201 length:456 start_codon:yes stop_codon:yes gene_type:complete